MSTLNIIIESKARGNPLTISVIIKIAKAARLGLNSYCGSAIKTSWNEKRRNSKMKCNKLKLKMAGGVKAETIEELREHFDLIRKK